MSLPFSFSESYLRALGGPDWLSRLRHEAFDRAARASLPTGEEEIWRYSRIADLSIERFSPLVTEVGPKPQKAQQVTSAELPRPVAEFLGTLGETAAVVHVHDGAVVSVTGGEHDGLSVTGLAVLEEQQAHFGEVVSAFIARADSATLSGDNPPVDLFDDLGTALTRDGAVVQVAGGSVVPQPVVVLHSFGPGVLFAGDDEERSGSAYANRTIIRVGDNAEASVIEMLVSGDEPMLVLPAVEIDVSDSARLNYSVVQQLGRSTWEIGHLFASAGRDATFRLFQASLGGEYARSRVDSVLTGQGGSAQLLAAYLGDGDQMHDFRTLQEHDAPRSTSDLVFKGAVGDRSRSVYSGLIRMRKGAKAANAFQTNRNLVLSDGAHADSVPNLDIEENDVRCSHASAVGPVDEEQRFYLESRGVPRRAAERLIVLGFFRELLERVPAPVARHVVTAIEQRVTAMTGAAL